MGTHWGLEGNIEGTCWEQRKNETNPPLTPTQNLNEKKSRHLECMVQPTHWLHVFLVAVGHHFWPRLMAGAEIEQGRKTKNNAPQKETDQGPP
jgi:hypothetical protein